MEFGLFFLRDFLIRRTPISKLIETFCILRKITFMRITIILCLLLPSIAFSQFQQQEDILGKEPLELSINPTGFTTDFQTDFKERKPGIAFLWSFLIPGAGQAYNKQYAKGGIMFTTSMAGLIWYLSGTESGTGPSGYSYSTTGAPAALVLMIGTSLWSMVDAPLIAQKLNEENGISFNLKPDLQLTPTGIGQKYALTAGPKLTIRF